MEALLRWNSKELGAVSPSKFIPMLEETGTINEVGDWSFHEISKQIAAWRREARSVHRVSMNISPVQFRQKDLTARIRSTVEKFNVPPELLAIEITEGTVMQDIEHAATLLSEMKRSGFSIAIDDFGTGYSSLRYIQKLPVDILKIDISFISNITKDEKDRTIVRTIIQMAKNLGLKTIAEGVETKEQLKMLYEMECDMAQGYYFSPPLPPENIFP